MIGKIISHYKILEKRGEGGMGVVYKAEDMELRRKVALKFLPTEYASDSEVLSRFKILPAAFRMSRKSPHPIFCTFFITGVIRWFFSKRLRCRI